MLPQIEYLSLDSVFVYAFSLIDTNISFLAAQYIADCMIILDEHISRRNWIELLHNFNMLYNITFYLVSPKLFIMYLYCIWFLCAYLYEEAVGGG